MTDNQYKIELGVKLRDNAIQDEIADAQKTLKPIEIKVDAETKELTNTIKEALNSLSKGTKNALTLDTSKLEASLNDVTSTIREIKTAIGTLDSSSNMKSLVSSINSISTALDKASDKFDGLLADLKSLSGKDFNLNFGINLGGSNSVARQGAYGNKVRSETLPQLKQQVSDLVKYYNTTYKESLNEFEALQKMVAGTKLSDGDFFENFLFGKDSVASRMGNGSLSSQMQAYKSYIDMFKQAASLKGVDLSSVTSGFSKSADELIKDAQDIQTGAKEMDESFDKLKQIFGGGGGLNIEGLSTSLEPIVKDLNEIREAVVNLSNGVSIEGLTSSFDKLSNSIEKLIKNCGNIKTAINEGVGSVGTSIGQSANDVKSVDSELKQVTITSKNTAEAIRSLQDNLKNMQFGSKSIDVVTKELQSMGIEIKEATAELKGANLDITVKGIDELGETVTVVRRLNTATDEITQIGTKIKQSFSTSDDFIKEVNKEMANFVKMQKQIGNMEVKIKTLESQGGDADYIANLKRQLAELENTYERLMDTFSRRLFDNADIMPFEDVARFDNEIIAVVQNTKNRLRELEIKGDASAVKEINSEMANFVKLQTQISNMETKIGKLELAGGNENQVAELKRQLEELENTYASLMHTFSKKLVANADIVSMGDIANFDDEIAAAAEKARDKLRELESKYADTKAKLAKDIEIKIDVGKFDAEITKVTANFNKLSLKSDDIETDIKQLNTEFSNMQTAAAAGDIDALINAYEKYGRILDSVNNKISINTIKQQEANRQQKQTSNDDALTEAKVALRWQIDDYLAKNTAAAKQFGDTIRKIRASIDTCDDSTALKHLEAQFKNIKAEANTTLKSTQSFGDKIKKQWQQYSTYLGVASIFQYAEQGLRSMFEQVKLIDSAMTELKKVTNETDATYSKFLTNAADRARVIGTTIDGLVSSTADFARLGYGFEDAQGLAEVANIYAVVGDEINGVEGATESLISTMAAFKGEMNGMSNTDFAMSIIDKFNEIGNNFAISSGGIGEALERSASSLMAANNTIDESIALITAANTVVQDPEQVGTAFKTISMRIRGAKTELEEAGLETEGMVDSTAKLRQEIMALSGVDIMASATEFKSTYQIMDELAQKWEDLTDIQQAKCLPDNVEIH